MGNAKSSPNAHFGGLILCIAGTTKLSAMTSFGITIALSMSLREV
jgi:hypothetical protein